MYRSLAFLLVSLAAAASPDAGPGAPPVAAETAAPVKAAEPIAPDAFAALPIADRRAAYLALDTEHRRALLAGLTMVQLIGIARQSLDALGSYQAELLKRERVGGELLPLQTLHIEVREAPYAIRMEVIDGPAKGRRVLYNQKNRPAQLRAKESGILGLVGGVWIDKDGSMARGDTNHSVSDTGFGNTLRIVEGDVSAAAAAGGMVRKDDGFDARGDYCISSQAPPGAKTYARRARLCFDPLAGLPMSIECFDDKGLFEQFEFRNLQAKPLSEADFMPDAFGL